MENREILNAKVKKEKEFKISKIELAHECLSAIVFFLFSLLLSSKKMLFDTFPLAFALLSACTGQAPFVWIGIIAGSWSGEISLIKISGACIVLALRIVSRLYIDKGEIIKTTSPSKVLYQLFSEHTYLRIMSGALGVFGVGVWRIIQGGFRFYDLFASIFYLVLTPVATWIFSWYFNLKEQKRRKNMVFSITGIESKLYDVSLVSLACAGVFALDNISILGINIPIFVAVIFTLYECKKGVLYGVVAGLLLGVSYSPSYAPAFAFCAIAYVFIGKLSLFGGAIASCISGVVWVVYTGGIYTLATAFPAIFTSSVVFCTAEKFNIFENAEILFKKDMQKEKEYSVEGIISTHKNTLQEEKIRSVSESFAALSEVFYNLSSKLKRPTMLDLRTVCEESFKKHCINCENCEICFGADYDFTLDVMKKITLQLHSSGCVDENKIPKDFVKKCPSVKELSKDINESCARATKKAFLNEKTEIFALDYDAISKILNDAIGENEKEFQIDKDLSETIADVIAEEGYGEHTVTAFGKRKLKIFALGLDLSDQGTNVSRLKQKLEEITHTSLADPSFELAFGSVNMQIEACPSFTVDKGFVTATGEGESVCGDAVSVFENKDDYMYALISDGMGTGNAAAVTSEVCNSFLQNMLTVGNKMETSLRMLNSILRVKGSKSETECSATIDLLQIDLYSGAMSLVKSGAAPTFVLRRGNVFKLASPSFPIGILRALDAKQINISCEDGDIIVMVSDGALKEEDDCSCLIEMLKEKNLEDDSAQTIANKILRRAKSEIDPPTDDISVVVIKVKKEFCNW